MFRFHTKKRGCGAWRAQGQGNRWKTGVGAVVEPSGERRRSRSWCVVCTALVTACAVLLKGADMRPCNAARVTCTRRFRTWLRRGNGMHLRMVKERTRLSLLR